MMMMMMIVREFVLGANQFGFQAGQIISRAEQIDSKLLYLFLMN